MHHLVRDVRSFMQLCDQVPESGPPRTLPAAASKFRVELLLEEVREYLDADTAGDVVEIADALADIIYIVVGTAVAHRIPLDRVWREVQRSNMAKVHQHGEIVRSDTGKILKPDGWVGPAVAAIIDDASKAHDLPAATKETPDGSTSDPHFSPPFQSPDSDAAS